MFFSSELIRNGPVASWDRLTHVPCILTWDPCFLWCIGKKNSAIETALKTTESLISVLTAELASRLRRTWTLPYRAGRLRPNVKPPLRRRRRLSELSLLHTYASRIHTLTAFPPQELSPGNRDFSRYSAHFDHRDQGLNYIPGTIFIPPREVVLF